MVVGVIDADLIGRKKHRFPNLAVMKISGYHKSIGDTVVFLDRYEDLDSYDRVYVSKVFTDTPCDVDYLEKQTVDVRMGGTGFYFDKAPNLPDKIEHCMPDYHLYDKFVSEQIHKGVKRNEFKEYLDYSIGFTTRGCFRKCGFCVNKKYDRVFLHSPLDEFYDPERKKICLLDDNILGCKNWREILEELQNTGKPFKYKQGLDERLLTDEKCKVLFSSKYDGEYTFAFDKIDDYDLIHRKLDLIRSYTDKQCKFYVLCGFDNGGGYSEDFWKQDIIDTFERIKLLGKYHCLPYIMRNQSKDYVPYQHSQHRGIYITLARWVNQPSFFKKKSFYEYCLVGGSSSLRYFEEFNKIYPEILNKYMYEHFWN